jgi:hypothetical protein
MESVGSRAAESRRGEHVNRLPKTKGTHNALVITRLGCDVADKHREHCLTHLEAPNNLLECVKALGSRENVGEGVV